jgi:hypothetical protein
LESPRILEKRSSMGNMEKDGDKRVGREGKELERDQGVGQEQDLMEALHGCPMLLIRVTGIRRRRNKYEVYKCEGVSESFQTGCLE